MPMVNAGIRLLGLPAEKSAKKQLTGSADEVVRTIASLVDQIVSGAVEKRTAAEYIDSHKASFQTYVQLVVALAGIVSAVVPNDVLSRLTTDSFSELEADIREHALAAFGAEMRNRAMFTVWTLRKIADLIPMIGNKPPNEEGMGACDKEFANLFLFHALRARFNIDVLRFAMRHSKTIYPDVLPAIDDGLRSVVDAYAWIRQAADLRCPPVEVEYESAPWDDEDEQLLTESMLDLANETF